ncbi:MAG: ADP-ribosylglycohydrolase family protein [Planctomycetales bacterium]|nr:ADP-ribosylglycohydrolase family protein [Planctomycetales bacterium]
MAAPAAPEPTVEERYEGCLLGLACGDALGVALEFLGREQARIKLGIVREMLGSPARGLRPGETTDDTAMALALAESLAAKGAHDPADALARYLAWFGTNPPDVGVCTRAALTLASEGVPAAEASRRAHDEVGGRSAGNGAAMRAAPLGLRFRGRPAECVRAALADARITHWDPRAGAAAGLVALLVADMANGGRDLDAALGRSVEALDAAGASASVPDLAGLRKKSALQMRSTGLAEDTIECALWALATTKSFEEALVAAVNLAGDADTVGAIAGAIGGARDGARAIPERWTRRLAERARLRAAAAALLAASGGGSRGAAGRSP